MTELSLHVDLSSPPEEVWALVGDFGALATWHPWVPNCTLSEDGLTRTIDLGHSAAIERLDASATSTWSQSYVVVESPMPITDYRATWSVEGSPTGCRLIWNARFTPLDDNAVFMLKSFFEQGFNALAERFGRGP